MALENSSAVWKHSLEADITIDSILAFNTGDKHMVLILSSKKKLSLQGKKQQFQSALDGLYLNVCGRWF